MQLAYSMDSILHSQFYMNNPHFLYSQLLDFIAACLLLSRIRQEQLRRPYYAVDGGDKATF